MVRQASGQRALSQAGWIANLTIAPVVSLLLHRCPSAVFRRVIVVVVNPVERKARRRLSHVSKEVLEPITAQPPLANANASTAVILPNVAVRIHAALFHSNPTLINDRGFTNWIFERTERATWFFHPQRYHKKLKLQVPIIDILAYIYSIGRLIIGNDSKGFIALVAFRVFIIRFQASKTPQDTTCSGLTHSALGSCRAALVASASELRARRLGVILGLAEARRPSAGPAAKGEP